MTDPSHDGSRALDREVFMLDRTVRPRAVLRHDPVLLAVAGSAVLLALWYLSEWGGARVTALGFGLGQSAFGLVMAVLCRRAARLPGLPRPARRFWYAFAITGLCAGTGDLVQVVLDLDAPVVTSTISGTAHQLGLGIGVCFPLAAMLALPNGSGPPRERVRFWLDAATVVAGAAAFAWYTSVSPTVNGVGGEGFTRPVLTVVVELVAAFAVVKLMLTGAAGFAREAAVVGAVGITLDGLTTGLIPRMADSPGVSLLVAAQMLTVAMIASTPRIRELRVRAHPELLIAPRKRPYSVLPYFAVAATSALLVSVLVGAGIQWRVWGVLICVVVGTGLVVVRQLVAFSDNASLLAQLDASLGELRRQEQLMRHQASHDHLTQLANRALFTERAEVTAAQQSVGTAVVMIDLDDFKLVNDSLGHHVGDAVLVAVADRLRSCVRPGDTVARLGGDEFAILLPAATEADGIGVVERISAALVDPVLADGHVLAVRASIGLATGCPDDPEALLRDADNAMYAAKRDGKITAGAPPDPLPTT